VVVVVKEFKLCFLAVKIRHVEHMALKKIILFEMSFLHISFPHNKLSHNLKNIYILFPKNIHLFRDIKLGNVYRKRIRIHILNKQKKLLPYFRGKYFTNLVKNDQLDANTWSLSTNQERIFCNVNSENRGERPAFIAERL